MPFTEVSSDIMGTFESITGKDHAITDTEIRWYGCILRLDSDLDTGCIYPQQWREN